MCDGVRLVGLMTVYMHAYNAVVQSAYTPLLLFYSIPRSAAALVAGHEVKVHALELLQRQEGDDSVRAQPDVGRNPALQQRHRPFVSQRCRKHRERVLCGNRPGGVRPRLPSALPVHPIWVSFRSPYRRLALGRVHDTGFDDVHWRGDRRRHEALHLTQTAPHAARMSLAPQVLSHQRQPTVPPASSTQSKS